MAVRQWTDAEIQAMVQDLDSLSGGKSAAAALVGCGPRAIARLREFLLGGRPRGVFQPRQLAVETLAELGAKEVLIEYLGRFRKIDDPGVRFGEEAVVNTAARALAQWRTEDTYQALRELTACGLLPGLVESLGKFGREETIPYFIRALGDDVCRESAVTALRGLRQDAWPQLIETAKAPEPSSAYEFPSSLIRRREALRILADGGISPAEWLELKPLLRGDDPEIACLSAAISLEIGEPAEWHGAIRRVIELLPRMDWPLQSEAKALLRKHFREGRELIQEEIARRSAASLADQALDMILRLLVNVQMLGKQEQAGRHGGNVAH